MASLMLLLATGVANDANASGGGQQAVTQQPKAAAQQKGQIKLLKEKPEVAPIPKKNKPNRIIANINGDTKTQMAFNWFTTDKAEQPQVWVSTTKDFKNAKVFAANAEQVDSKYVERDKTGHIIFEDIEKNDDGKPVKDKNGKPKINGYYTDEHVGGPEWTSGNQHGKAIPKVEKEYVYKAQATGLKPNTTYYYKVGAKAGKQSEVGTFKTSGQANDNFKFVQYTDTQNAFWNEHVNNEAKYGANTIAEAIKTAGNPNFALHTGDFVQIAQVEDEWNDIYGQSRPSFMSLPIVAVSGNHDEYSFEDSNKKVLDLFNRHVNVPKANNAVNGGSYYSFDYNNMHMVVANTNDNKKGPDNPEGKAIGQTQFNWIKEDIKKARANGAKWIVLSMHKPMYSKSYHALEDKDIMKLRDELTKEIDDLNVDLVLQGHDHVLARTKVLEHTSTKSSFVNAKIEDAKQIVGADGVKYYDNPKGSVYVLPNTGGTKAYDDIYSKPLEHIKKVRPKLGWLTEAQRQEYNNLFALGEQPQKTDAFNKSHENNRDSTAQNFTVYEVKGNKLIVKVYQLHGDLSKGEPRTVTLVDQFGISKDK
ncbi:metallophosphoesterase [Staphylococcus simulans]|uniref:metallophosphoesterase n=1 Tax=Staphylococcus simulans TaxID=1286 RepID=UPI00399B129F